MTDEPIPTVPPTPAGDMAGEDDAWLAKCINRLHEINATILNARKTEITTRRLEDWSADISGIARALRSFKLAREGARREPVAWQIWSGAQWKFHNAAIHAPVAGLRDNGTIIRPLYAAPPASVDAVAVVTDEMVDAAWAEWGALADAGQIYRTQMREVILAALRARQQGTEARS